MLLVKSVTVVCRRFGILIHFISKKKCTEATVMSLSQPSYDQSHGRGNSNPDLSSETQQIPSFAQTYRLKCANLRLKKGSTPVCATVIHPGLPTESFGLTGQPTLSTLLKAASFARMYAMHVPLDEEGHTFLQYDKLTAGALTFFASTQVDILPAMYDFEVPKQPLEVTVQPGHIGRTSLSTVSTMLTSEDQPDQHALMTQISQIVLVDKTTRRPQPIDDQWRHKYQGQCVRGEPLIISKQPLPQDGALGVYEVKVAWSDTDIYQHTNFSSYPRFALDAVHDALRLGKLGDHLTAADFAAGLCQVRVAYLGESVEGDVLKVLVWPGVGDRCLVCSMEKEEQVVNQVTLTFFSPQP